MIKKFPEDASLNEIMYHLYVRKKILLGLQDAEQGKTIPHEEVMKKLKKILLKVYYCLNLELLV